MATADRVLGYHDDVLWPKISPKYISPITFYVPMVTNVIALFSHKIIKNDLFIGWPLKNMRAKSVLYSKQGSGVPW